jgi:hypothetical protein
MTANRIRGPKPRWLLGLSTFLILTLGLVLALSSTAASAQDNVLTVEDQSVEIDFPARITFNLTIDSPRPVERLELRYQPVFSDVSRAERPDFDRNERRITTSHELDLRTRYLPPGIDIEYRWIVTLDNGQQLETPQQSFFFNDNRYDWIERTEGPVSIYFYDGGDSFGELAMEVTNRTLERFGSDFDVQLDDPINIVIYGSVADFQDALPYNSPEWIGGFADPGQNLIVAGIAPGSGAATEMGRMLTHEVVHLLVAQATLNPFNGPPRWLDEGLAINYQEVQEERFRRVLNLAMDEGRLIPLPALRSSFPSDPDLAILSYAQSESIVEFLIDEYGYESIAALLVVYRDGVSHGQAVERTLGRSLDELDAEWKEWLGYDGDADGETAMAPLTPGRLERAENFLVNFGLMPVLVIGGMIVVVLGIVRMVQAVNVRQLDEDVGPEEEYYGQDMFDDWSDEPSDEDAPHEHRSTLT